MTTFSTYKCRLLGFIVFILFLFTVSTVCYAQFGGGDGTEQSPYQVGRAEHLDSVRDHLNAFFVQTADIDLGVAPWNEDEGWVPIANFRGNFNGQRFIINNLTIDRESNLQGLFGRVDNAIITNVKLENVDITARGRFIGALGGQVYSTTIRNCSATGSLVQLGSGVSGAANGGLIGHFVRGEMYDSGTDMECSFEGYQLGGLIGVEFNGMVRNCYALGNIISTCEGGNDQLGGLIGVVYGELHNSYARGSVTAEDNYRFVGSLVGENRGQIHNSYGTGRVVGGNPESTGGLVGRNTGQVNTGYWNTETTGREDSAGGDGRLTRQMTHPYDDNTYVNWDFEEIWEHDPTHNFNDGYPVLYFQEFDHIPALNTPLVEASLTVIENTDHILLSWEAIEDANSYRVYAADDPETENWGDPVAIIEQTQFADPVLDENRAKFYQVKASAQEAP